MFRTVGALVSAIEDGQTWTSFIHKTGGPASFGAGRWGDMSMGAGTPKYNAYVGTQFAATPLNGAGNDGIYLGPTPTSGLKRHLSSMQLQSTSTTLAPAFFLLCDYLMHYPLIDGDDTAEQTLDNTQSLPRYATGDGVCAMIVCTAPMTANSTVTVSYTNSGGVAGRSSVSSIVSTSVVGCLASSSKTSAAAGSVSPFIPLASGDKGIRSIQSVTNLTGPGGFYVVVLVKPIASIALRESATATEIISLQHRGVVPPVEDGAYLNFIYQPGQSGTAVTLRGFLQFAWG